VALYFGALTLPNYVHTMIDSAMARSIFCAGLHLPLICGQDARLNPEMAVAVEVL
jgi:hypothetical protein